MSDKDLQTINISPQKPKRSSLKLANLMDPKEIMNYSKKKRNSVSFQIGGNIKFRELNKFSLFIFKNLFYKNYNLNSIYFF